MNTTSKAQINYTIFYIVYVQSTLVILVNYGWVNNFFVFLDGISSLSKNCTSKLPHLILRYFL